MALQTTATPKATAVAAPATVDLELATYKRYSRKGLLYTKETEDGRPRVYTFQARAAQILLQEVDDIDQRPIWRRPRKIQTPVEIQVDRTKPVRTNATEDKVEIIELDDTALLGLPEGRSESRLDDGTDEELSELFGTPLDELSTGETQQI